MPQTQRYKAQDFSRLLGTPGFSDELLQTHFELYQGYVTNTNKALELMAEKTKDSDFDYEFGEIRRRFGWEFNGMRLHEYYFGLLKNGGSGLTTDGPLAGLMDDSWDDFDAWKADFSGTGSMRGIGWACLAYDPWNDRLFNTWLNEHDDGPLAGCLPVLLLDVFEHAFMKDYGTDKKAYFKSYYAAVDWEKVEAWFEKTHAGGQQLAELVH